MGNMTPRVGVLVKKLNILLMLVRTSYISISLLIVTDNREDGRTEMVMSCYSTAKLHHAVRDTANPTCTTYELHAGKLREVTLQ